MRIAARPSARPGALAVLTALGALALPASLFLAWFHVGSGPLEGDYTGWFSFHRTDRVLALLAILALATCVLPRTAAAAVARAVLGLGALLVVARELLDPPVTSAALDLGALAGLAASLAVLLGGVLYFVPTAVEERVRRLVREARPSWLAPRPEADAEEEETPSQLDRRLFRGIPSLSASALGLFRVAFGTGLFLAVSLYEPFTERLIALDLQKQESLFTRWAYPRWLGSTAEALSAVETITLVALALFVVGLFTRYAWAVAVLGLASIGMVRLLDSSGHDWSIPVVTSVCLLLVPWGAGFSLDETIRRLRGRACSPARGRRYGLAIWLPGLTIGVAFAAAAYAKLSGSGLEWITGGAVKYHFVEDAGNAHLDWGRRLTGIPAMAVLMSGVAVLVEAGFFLVVFFRRPLVRLAFAFLGLNLLVGFYLFQGVFWLPWWVLFLAFLPWQRMHDALRGRLPELVVLADGACPLCRRTARVLYAVDWLDRLEPADASDLAVRRRFAPGLSEEKVLADMHVVRSGSGEVRSGYAAYLWLGRSLPLLWPLGLVGALPGVRHLGEAVYRRVAASRRREHRCSEEECSVRSVARRALPARAEERPAPLVGALRTATLAVVAVLIAQQLVVSTIRVEHGPFLSNFPMYSYTWDSEAEFNAKKGRKNREYRYYVEGEGGRRADVTERIEDLTGGKEAMREAYELERGDEDFDEEEVDEAKKLPRRLRQLSAAYEQRYGSPLEEVMVSVEQSAGYDWRAQRFDDRVVSTESGRIDVASFDLSSTAAG